MLELALPIYQKPLKRAKDLIKRGRSLNAIFWDQLRNSTWERDACNIYDSDMDSNPLFSLCIMALLRAHQMINPSIYPKVYTADAMERREQAKFNLNHEATEEFTELYATVLIQRVNILARTLHLTPEEVNAKTIAACFAIFENLDTDFNELSLANINFQVARAAILQTVWYSLKMMFVFTFVYDLENFLDDVLHCPLVGGGDPWPRIG